MSVAMYFNSYQLHGLKEYSGVAGRLEI